MFLSSCRSSKNNLTNFTSFDFTWSLTWPSNAIYNRQIGNFPSFSNKFLPLYVKHRILSRANNSVPLSLSALGTWNPAAGGSAANDICGSAGSSGLGSTSFTASQSYWVNGLMSALDTAKVFTGGTAIGYSGTGGSGGNTYNVITYIFGFMLSY